MYLFVDVFMMYNFLMSLIYKIGDIEQVMQNLSRESGATTGSGTGPPE